MFGTVGPMELLIIFGGLLLVLGGRRLADAGKGLGQAIRAFKDEVTKPDPKVIEDKGSPEKQIKS